jgi:hypothetical protein
VLRKRARQAGITDLPSPHDLRRSHIRDLRDAGTDARPSSSAACPAA